MAEEAKKSKYLEGLNQEQKEAVTHKQGPLLIVAGAGTGKTTVITRRLAYLIEAGLAKSQEILGLTFTEKAAGEMEERIDRILPFGYLDIWVSTFHSFCERILKEHGLDIGLSTDFKLLDQTAGWLLVRQNLDKFNLDYYKPLGNPTKFIHALLTHFSRCKDEVIYPEDYLKYADDIKRNFDDGVFVSRAGDKKEKISQKEAEQESQRINEIANAYHVYQRLLLENNTLDFGDLINYCLKLFQKRQLILNQYREQFKYVLVDEFQDTNWAQYELIKTLVAPRNNLTVCADDDQCLPGHTKIEMFEKGKIRKELIKNIKKGQQVLTGVGKGHIGISSVNKVFKRKKKAKMLTVSTERGYKVEVTDNHKMFCFVPRTSQEGFHYVYLMYRQGIGWRIGVTDDLILRLRMERSADLIVGLKAFPNDRQARYYETLWSLKYGIPTSCFQARGNIIIKGNLLKKLYKDLKVLESVRHLAQDLNIDLNSPHHCLDAVNRGGKKRIVINLNMCKRRYRSKYHLRKGKVLLLNAPIRHEVTLQTSSSEALKRLKRAGFSFKKVRKGMSLRIESNNLQKLGQIVDELKELTGGFIKVKFNVASKNEKIGSRYRTHDAVVMPAKNLLQGHYIPVRKGKEIIYDRIVSIKVQERKQIVYDLEIDKTHNFIANGVVVHNSIYRWRGASVSNVLQFRSNYPQSKEVVLVKNYRSAQDILDLSYNFIQLNNPNRLEYQLNQNKDISEQAKEKGINISEFKKIDKRLRAQTQEKGFIQHLHFKSLDEEAEGVAEKISQLMKEDKEANFSDFAILVRANNSANIFCRALEKKRVPYEFLASRGLYSQPIILDIISYFKLLDNYHESSALHRLLNLPFLDITWEDLAKINDFSRKKGQSTYETLNEIVLVKGLSKKTIQQIGFLLDLIKKYSQKDRNKNVKQVFLAFLEESGYLKYIVRQEQERDIEFITQFYKKLESFEESQLEPTISNFVEQMNMEIESGETGALALDVEKGPDAVRLMTIHGAKGLEFKYVFIPNLVDKRFPTTERKEPIEIPQKLIKEILPQQTDIHLQEERRLFYVAMTRAEKGVFFTSADDYGGQRKKKLSRFLEELNLKPQCIEVDSRFKKEPEPVSEQRLPKKIKWQPLYFSYSQFAAFDKCPLQYKFAHILKIPHKGTASFSFGKTIHNTLRQFTNLFIEAQGGGQKGLFQDALKGFDKKVEEKEINLQEQVKTILEIYESNWIDEWYQDKEQKQEYYKLGKKILKSFVESFIKEKPEIKFVEAVPGLELDFRLKIKDSTIKGKIDRVDELPDGNIELIDYKTGKSKDKLAKTEKEQLLIYQLAGEQVLGKLPEKLTYYYLNDDKKLSFASSEKDREEFKQEILAKIDKIKNSDFKATPGWQCKYCDFKDICEFRKL